MKSISLFLSIFFISIPLLSKSPLSEKPYFVLNHRAEIGTIAFDPTGEKLIAGTSDMKIISLNVVTKDY